jgi:hypothetical protein
VEEIRIKPALQESASRPPETVEADRFSEGFWLGWLVTGLYLLSFFLPVDSGMLGYHAFICALVFVIGIPMWLANPVFWFGLVRLFQGRYTSAGTAGVVALLLALSQVWMFRGAAQVGYWVWVGSMGLLALAGLSHERETRPQRLPARSVSLPVSEASRIASRFHPEGERQRHGPPQSGDGVESKYTANEANQCSPA